jgi:thiol-disulfide isomerase/thioredoxin
MLISPAMRIFLISFLSFFSLSLWGQTNITIGEHSPKITVSDWLANKPASTSLEGKYIVLDFWATWCKPCLAAVPHINDLQRQFSSENVVFLSMTYESPEVAQRALAKVTFETPVVTDISRRTQVSFGDGARGLNYYPLTVLIDQQNIVRWVGNPVDLTAPMVAAFLQDQPVSSDALQTKSPVLSHSEIRASKNEAYTMEWWSDLFHTSTLEWLVHIQPETTQRQKVPQVNFGNGAYYEQITLPALFRILFPQKQILLPEAHQQQAYRFVFIDKTPDGNSPDRLLAEIMDQLGWKFNQRIAEKTTFAVKVKRPARLKESTHIGFDGYTEEPDGVLFFQKQTLADLLLVLSQKTDSFWELDAPLSSNANERYEFRIQMDSTQHIIESLEAYGLKVKAKPTQAEVIDILPDTGQ